MSARAIELRALDTGDLGVVEAIERDCFSNPWPRSAFEMALYADEILLLGALIGGELSGYATAVRFGSDALLANLAVAPASRRQGIASALLGAVIDWARVMRADRCRLEVRESNVGAAALYARHGFRDRGRVPGYYSNPAEDAVTMVLDLATAKLSRRGAREGSAPASTDAAPPGHA